MRSLINRMIPKSADGADPVFIKQAVHNVVQNSIEATLPGHDSVRTARRDKSIEIRISDSARAFPRKIPT